MTDYEKQAQDFLDKTNTTIEKEFLKNDKHFEDDTSVRDIYNITIKRGNRSFDLTFGQSIMDSQYYQHKNIKERTYTLSGAHRTGGYKIDRLSNYKEYLKLIAGKIPTNYDILASITSYDPGTFENFCSDFGYDIDSKKAERIYNSVLEEWKNVQIIWTDEEIELLKEIQ